MKIIFAITILFLVFSFNFVLAAGIDLNCQTNPDAYPWCQQGAKDPAGLVSSFYKIALGLAGAAALGVLIYGAVLWTLSGAVTSKQDAREWISGALWGLVLLLGAYLILYTINPRLVEIGKTQEALKEAVKPVSQEVIETDKAIVEGTFEPAGPFEPIPESKEKPITPIPESLKRPDGKISATATRKFLEGTNISINKKEGQGTNIEGLQSETFGGLLNIYNRCGECKIEIDGGTETTGGHVGGKYSHLSGYKLDFEYDGQQYEPLRNYIYKQIGTSNLNYNVSYKGKDGNTYRLEKDKGGTGSHWDVCFNCKK